MKFSIISQDPSFQLHIDADKLIIDNDLTNLNEENFIDEFQKAIEESSDIDYLRDIICDAKSDFEPEPQGSYDLEKAEHILYKIAEENLQKLKENTTLTIIKCDEKETPVQSRKISYFDILSNLLETDYGDSGWYANVGGYIEKCLEAFVRRGTWHFGLQAPDGKIEEDILKWPAIDIDNGICKWIYDGCTYQPIIWYGLSDTKPDSKWILWSRNQPMSKIWTADSDWEIMEELIRNVNDSFLIWYTAECGYSVPDVSGILDECPVNVCIEDSAQEISDKMEAFFARTDFPGSISHGVM